MKKEKIVGTCIVLTLNLVLFLYFLADTGSLSVFLRDVIFMAIIGVLAVFFGYFINRWWLVFLGAVGILFLGIRAIFLAGGIDSQWVADFVRVISPILIMEVLAFSGSLMKKRVE
jgi:hypothetical protein